jgi:hypothetical protein
VPPAANQHAALLPGREVQGGDLYRLLSDPARGLPSVDGTPAPERYAGGLKLDAIGQPTVTAGVSGWGSYVSGGMSAFFSDMLGDRMLGVSVQAGGTPSDIGGQLMYVNRQHRWNWAGSIEALPYRVGSMVVQQNPAAQQPLTDVLDRQSSRGASARLRIRPRLTRFEVSGGMCAEFSEKMQTRVRHHRRPHEPDHQSTNRR